MPESSQHYKIEKVDFGYEASSKLQRRNTSSDFRDDDNSNVNSSNKFKGFIKALVSFSRKFLKRSGKLFEKTKWRISRSIFLGRGIYFKYISNLSILIIIVFGTFVYLGYYANSEADRNFPISRYAKANSSTEITQYPAGIEPKLTERQFNIVKYKVSGGDTLSSIAKKFSTPENEISVDSIKWANNVQEGNLQVGAVLDILPVSGTLHTVQKGESAVDVAKKYRKITDQSSPEEVFAVMQELTDMNLLDIEVQGDKKVPILPEGAKILVPGGVIYAEQPQPVKTAQAPQTLPQRTAPRNTTVQPVTGNRSLIWPVYGGAGTVTRGLLPYHTGVDIADFSGPSLVASAAGSVVSTGWELGGGGCVVRVKFDNGFLGLYAHTVCGSYQVVPGQRVVQGQVLARMGSTGNSTGTHVHFELYSPQGALLNPFAYISR